MTAYLLTCALILDAIFGEPNWLWSRVPHPAVLMGHLIDAADRRFNSGAFRKARGTVVVAGLVIGAILLGRVIAALPFGALWQILGAAILLAQKSLVQHVAAVATALRASLVQGRRAVAMIVGRDTAAMDEPAVTRAAIESAAENFSDGVVAPAFWFLVGGLPGILVYKIVNTADSMIGHRTPRHEDFGWAAARLDDLLNLIPARLTALLIWVVARPEAPRDIVLRDAPLHRSPNAGWPEAAMAVALDVALSGPRSYHGERRDFPWVHADGNRHPGPEAIDRAVRLLWQVWAAVLLLSIAGWSLRFL